MFKAFTYLVIFIVGFVGVSLWSFWLITHPPKIIIGGTPEKLGLKYENVELKTKDGLKLAAWYIPRSAAQNDAELNAEKRGIILIHGYPAEKADMLTLAQHLTSNPPAGRAGFSLLLFDMRSFGQSEGRVSTLGKKELWDLEAALDFLESRGYKKIGIFGFSLGGAVAIMKAANDLPAGPPAGRAGKAGPRIAAVAVYAPFADLKLLGYDAYKNLWILKYPLVELLSLWARLFFDYDIVALSPEKAAAKLQIPIFLFHQQQDDQIPFEHANRLKQALRNNKNAIFLFPERGTHGDFPSDFDQKLLEFFEKSLK